LPALRFDDGVVLEDSIVILDELERRYPDLDLVPSDPRERSVDLLWDSFLNDHVYWYGFWLRWADPKMSPLFADAMFARQPWWFRTLIVPAVLRRQKSRLQHQGFLGKSPEDARAMMLRALDMLVEGIGGGPFLQGRSTPARGDLAAAAMVVQTGFRGSMPDIETEVRARPSLIRHAAATYRACNAPPTRWLAKVAPAADGAAP
jgi:glutathione S-transferase